MGMFDYITCEYPLPRPDDAVELKDQNFNKIFSFQTKSLGSILDNYKIKKDKTIWIKHQDKKWKQVKDFTGEIDFHDGYALGLAEADALKNDYWIEYRAVFIDGNLKDVKLVKFEVTDNEPRKKRCEEWTEQEAFRKELWNRWYMKYGYRYYDYLVKYVFHKLHILSYKLPPLYQIEKWLRPL